MADGRRFRVTLKEAEVLALLMAMSEYVYLLEEGNIGEATEEADLQLDDPPLTASEAADLMGRLEGLL